MPTQRPLGPSDRSDGPLRVLVIGRISTEQQSEQSIEASYRYVQDYLRRMGANLRFVIWANRPAACSLIGLRCAKPRI